MSRKGIIEIESFLIFETSDIVCGKQLNTSEHEYLGAILCLTYERKL